jgi:GNAT superfamily N-acetyltransferase
MNYTILNQTPADEQMDAFTLWMPDFEDAWIEGVYIAINRQGEVVGFQTVNEDNLTVAIEVLGSYQGQGIATKLVLSSGSTKPERNECPDFWAKFE